MASSLSELEEMLRGATESLSTEIKSWFDLESSAGKKKLISACMALRNRNGGYLIIGLNNKDGTVEKKHFSELVEDKFHTDKIHEILTKYILTPFSVEVSYPKKDSQKIVVIEIPSGVRTPACVKKELLNEDDKIILERGDVYFRTLNANNVPSTSKTRPNDWEDVLDICFNNREADIARFLRRHFRDTELDSLIRKICSRLTRICSWGGRLLSAPLPTKEDGSEGISVEEPIPNRANIIKWMDESKDTLFRLAEEKYKGEDFFWRNKGSWEVGLQIFPETKNVSPGDEFMNLLRAANPNYTGWPIWLDSRNFSDERARPVAVDWGWEAAIISLGARIRHIDLQRFMASGKFYLYRTLQDDLTETVVAGKEFDAILSLIRIAEAIAVGHSIAKTIDSPKSALLNFVFRWNGLKGRSLSAWANPGVFPPFGREAFQNQVISHIEMPLEVAVSGITPYVSEVVKPLFHSFSGFSMSPAVIEDWTNRLLERRL